MQSSGAKLFKPNAERVMVFAPHPDDDLLGCGGTLIEHVKKGATVTVVYMTSLEMHPHTMGSHTSLQKFVKMRQEGPQKKLVLPILFF